MKKIFSQYLDLPKLELKWPKGDPENVLFAYYTPHDRELQQHDGTYIGVVSYVRWQAADEYVNWFYNIVPELKGHVNQIGWQYHLNLQNHPNGVQHTPHTDGPRGQHVIQFLLDAGGPSPITKWYQEPGHPIERLPKYGSSTTEETAKLVKNYLNLIELESIQFEVNRWSMMRADILHSVYPVMTTRESFTVGFSNQELYEYIGEKYGVKE